LQQQLAKIEKSMLQRQKKQKKPNSQPKQKRRRRRRKNSNWKLFTTTRAKSQHWQT
jgi:hypothetical protein